MVKRSLFFIILSLSVICLNIVSGCKRSVDPSAEEALTTQSSPEPTPRDEFERNLRYIRQAHFQYIWLFSRKDGAPLDKADGEVLSTNTPGAVDRIKADEEGRRFLVGSNYDIEPENMAALRKRFNVENYSGK
ncbi:MAG: hypothetical protein ABI596_10425 [Pyrinomonadaceae bacterium]